MTEENPEVLLFLHIPKTGGSTLRRILARIYPLWETVRIYPPRMGDPEGYLRKVLADEERTVSCVVGHFPYGLHESIPLSSTYLTMVRDPVDRVLSHYHFMRRTEDHPLHERAGSMTVREYVGDPSRWDVDNGQVRYLTDNLTLPHDRRYKELGERHLREAKRVLEQEDVIVGTTNRFDLSVLLAADRLGWPAPHYIRRNVGSERPRAEDLTEETLRLIKDRNRLDMELHRYAQKLLEKRTQDAGIGEEDVRAFRRSNERYRLAYPVLHAPIPLIHRAIWKIRQ